MSSSPRLCRELGKSSPTSPNKKLQRSVRNQTSPGLKNNPPLRLRHIDLTAPPNTIYDIFIQCGAQTSYITYLDISYSITESTTLKILCTGLTQLHTLIAVECGLSHIAEDTPWPSCLRSIDLSRNQLNSLPLNLCELLELTELNLSGNAITELNPSLLALPKLTKIRLLNNPIRNVPKNICRDGIRGLRQFFKVTPRSIPNLDKKHPDFRRYALHNQASTDSGYESRQRSSSQCSASSFSDIDSVGSVEEEWPLFGHGCLPAGYSEAVQLSNLCQVYLPDGCDFEIMIDTVKDLSLYPKVSSNELLISPVVRISPHGIKFPQDKSAIIVLSHCTKPMDTAQQQRIVPLCSDTGMNLYPNWTELSLSATPKMFKDCVMFTTTHFSLFAVLASIPYPSKSIVALPNEYNLLEIQEIEGLRIEFLPNSVASPTRVDATVYYTDLPYAIANSELSPATACLGVEPHGLLFNRPVRVSVPVPHFTKIKQLFPAASIQLYHAPHNNTGNGQLKWKLAENQYYEIAAVNGVTVISFKTAHFSLFDFVWNISVDTLQKFGLGASYVYKHLTGRRARSVSVKWQAFMTPPLRDLSFGLALCVHKFGEPLKGLSNYPWLVGEDSKGVSLQVGELGISLQGHFTANQEVGESLDRTTTVVDFTGEDFVVRFDFALKLSDQLCLPMEDGQFLGKLKFSQTNSDRQNLASYNLHKVNFLLSVYIFIDAIASTAFSH